MNWLDKFIVSERGQWDYPGYPTAVPTKNGRITMEGVPYPVMGFVLGQPPVMMQPGKNYKFYRQSYPETGYPGGAVIHRPAPNGAGLKNDIRQIFSATCRTEQRAEFNHSGNWSGADRDLPWRTWLNDYPFSP